MKKLLAQLERVGTPTWIVFFFLTIAVIGFADYLTGYELAFSLFYLLPILMITWLSGYRLGIVASLASALVWFLADMAAGNVYSSSFVYVWNTLIRLGFFVTTALLLTNLKRALDHERELAHSDFLTGSVNSRFFYKLVQLQIDQLDRYRHPFTLAYIDLDDFKAINDEFGHLVGDRVLLSVVNVAKKCLRKSDVVARLGGDEFMFLLPEADRVAARAAITRCRAELVEEMKRSKWPVTFSIGVLTCTAKPKSVDELLKAADDLMYAAKRSGKNAVEYSTYPG